MIYWILTLTAGLLIVIGTAAGIVGATLSVLAFLTALFLLQANNIGYREAWTRFGLDRFAEPFLTSSNWDRLIPIFEDLRIVFIAGTVAVALVAFSLTLPVSVVLTGIVVVAGLAVIDVLRTSKQSLDRSALDAPKLIGSTTANSAGTGSRELSSYSEAAE